MYSFPISADTHLSISISGELGVMLGQWEGFAAEALNEKLMCIWQAGEFPEMEHPLSSLGLNRGCL